MTQAERLIRNLCEARRLAVLAEERATLQAWKASVSWKRLPAAVRAAVVELGQLRKRMATLEQVIRAAGFQVGYDPTAGKSLDLKDAGARRAVVMEGFARRRERIAALRTEATIASLGMSAADARKILHDLQAALGKI